MTTELTLENWLAGQVSAERMCLHVLSLEGFEELDPQSPYGGPDGRKDILCKKNDWRYVAAAYFPTEKITRFATIKEKFEHDLEGVGLNGSDGIVFLTGQKLTPGERSELESLAKTGGAKAILYHQERIRGVLDSPIGFAARLQHLNIPMKPEEQLAFVLAFQGAQDRASSELLAKIDGKIDRLLSNSAEASTWQADTSRLLTTLSTRGGPGQSSGDRRFNEPVLAEPGSQKGSLTLSTNDICNAHKALLFESPGIAAPGRYRTSKIWIGRPDSTADQAAFLPPPSEEIERLMAALLDSWNQNLEKILAGSSADQIEAITQFHLSLLNIHPFEDGNGRLSRYFVQDQAWGFDLTRRPVTIRDRAGYALAIAKAQAGELEELRRIVRQAITGAE